MKQLESCFKRKINWNKYQYELKILPQNSYLGSLIDPRLLGVNRLFVLSFKNETHRELHTKYYLWTAEI